MNAQNTSALFRISAVILFLTAWLAAGTIGFCQSEKKEEKEKEKAAALSSNAKKINERSLILTANVISASKGAKGVGAPIADREKWEAIAVSAPFKNVIAEAVKLQKLPIPEPSETDYMRYYETEAKALSEVNRDYENKYWQRRGRLYRLVLAECFENKGRFLRDIEESIDVICSEPAWSIPWDDGDAKKFKGESRNIDHQIARTAWDLATIHYWLGKKLSSRCRDLIDGSVKARVFDVFEEAVLTDHYELIDWANKADHYNAMGHAAVVGAALALIDSADLRAKYIASAEINVEKFLQIFTRDGYFPDGAQAWNEGYGSFILLAEILYQATKGRIDMFKRPNIKEAALYGSRMEITPGVFESFGDRWRGARPSLIPTAFISKRFKMGLTDIENRAIFFGIGPGQLPNTEHLYNIGIYCFSNSATEEKGLAAKSEVPPLETLRNEFPLNGVMILRTGKKDKDQIGVQLKGGNNDERSNHSDAGTYIVALGNGIPLCDIGARYNRRGLVIEDRMESNFVNSFGHPVPRIDETLQKNGKGTVVPLLERKYTDDIDTLKFDLQYVYEWADPKAVKELSRTFIFDRTGKDPDSGGKAMLTVVDCFRSRKPIRFENCLITFGPFKMLTKDEDASVQDLIVGEGDQALHITVSNEVVEIADVETAKKTDSAKKKYMKLTKPLLFEAGLLEEPVPHSSKVPFRLGFSFEELVDEMTMTIKIRPAAAAEKDLAKKSPDEADRVYTSSIDIEPEVVASETTLTGGLTDDGETPKMQINPAEKEKAYEMLCDEIVKKLPATVKAQLKKMSDDELKTQFRSIKSMNPALRVIPDDDDEICIKILREKL